MFSDTESTSGGAAPDVGLQDVWQLLELAAIHHADKLAVIDCAAGSGGRQLTYSQLFDRAAALAAHLAAAGVRRGDRIGVLSRNAAHVIELHFAAAAIHAVVVNLNIHLAPRELAFICADSEPKLVFADTHCAAALLAAHTELRSQDAAAEPGRKRPVFDNVVWMRLEGNGALPAEVEGLQVGHEGACSPCTLCVLRSQTCTQPCLLLQQEFELERLLPQLLLPCRVLSMRPAWLVRRLVTRMDSCPAWLLTCWLRAARKMDSTCTTRAAQLACPRVCC